MWRRRIRFSLYSVAAVSGCSAAWTVLKKSTAIASIKCDGEDDDGQLMDITPPRQSHVTDLKSKELDILVIGGGATGAGCTLDAISRGLSVACVEKFDFASGTSSRSTKLIHGGVRYLQKAVFNLDIEQYRMVREALTERGNLMQIAPHLAYRCPIMLPVYKYWQIPYFWAGLKAYDLVAGSKNIGWSYYISKKKALQLFPMLKDDELKGALVYYDGQHEDARMCLSIIMTAARLGAHTLNYTEVLDLKHKEQEGQKVVCGATVKDKVSGEIYDIKAKCVINATGPYTDQIRTMSSADVKKICQPSSGTHIVLPNYYSPDQMGLLDPQTSDGRIIFFLPWQGATIAGTTDTKCDLTDNPSPSEDEVRFILSEIRHYLSPDVTVRRGDVLSCWTGLRPLVMDPNKKDTQSLARNHIIEVGPDKLITIAGGKWTTYRHMAQETLDTAVEECKLKPKRSCQTLGLLLDGAAQWCPNLHIKLVQDFGVDFKVAQHLAREYGDRSMSICKLARLTGLNWPILGKRLHPNYPYIEAEIIWAIRTEYARRAIDIIARRTRLAFLNVTAADQALPRIVEIMGKELGWSKQEQQDELEYCKKFMQKEMGFRLKADNNLKVNTPFTKPELEEYVTKFKRIDIEGNGCITVNDLRRHLEEQGEKLAEDQLSEMLNEVDANKNGSVDFSEFLQLMQAVKFGHVVPNRFVQAANLTGEKIPTDRSGGGV